MPPAHYWYEIPTTLFAGDTSDWIAVLPIAAIEQHGPHLPVMVDSRLVAEVGRLSAIESSKSDQPTLVLP